MPTGEPAIPAAPGAPTPLWVALGLALGPAAALGFARFAYALLLPPMRADLGWSYAQAGAVNAANAAGYLLGALIAAAAAERLGTKRSFTLALLATGAALLLSALTRDYLVLLLLRLLAGASGALVFVAGGGLAAAAGLAAGSARAALLLAVYFAGPGLGILLAGPAVAVALGPAGTDWPAGWLALGAAALAATLLSWPALRRVPAGHVRAAAGEGFRIRPLAPVFLSYALFGAGYIAYMTFIIAFLRARGLGEAEIAVFWLILGAAAIPAAFVWGPLLARLPAGWGVFAVMTVLLAGALLPLLIDGPLAAFGSALLFGGSFLAVVTAVTNVGRRATRPQAWTRVIGALTVAFALGQCFGPILAGVLSDGARGLFAGMLLSAGLIAVGALTALAQRERHAAA